MQLKYRGVSYDYTPPKVTMEPTGVVGKYRGMEWRFRNPTKIPVLQPNLDLVYRGVPYHTGPVAAAPTPVAAASMATVSESTPAPVAVTTSSSASPVKELARRLMMSHHGLIKKREQSLLSRAAAEVGLGSDAAHYWSPVQGKIRSSFRNTYDRSAAALS